MREARETLIKRGLHVGEVSDVKGVTHAEFSDPNGNSWLLQEFSPNLKS
jgi:hypothetical protein